MAYLIMFVVSVILGLLFALRTQSIVNDRPYLATTWTFSSVFISCLLTTYIIQDCWQIIPISFGQALGTFIVMKCHFFNKSSRPE